VLTTSSLSWAAPTLAQMASSMQMHSRKIYCVSNSTVVPLLPAKCEIANFVPASCDLPVAWECNSSKIISGKRHDAFVCHSLFLSSMLMHLSSLPFAPGQIMSYRIHITAMLSLPVSFSVTLTATNSAKKPLSQLKISIQVSLSMQARKPHFPLAIFSL